MDVFLQGVNVYVCLSEYVWAYVLVLPRKQQERAPQPVFSVLLNQIWRLFGENRSCHLQSSVLPCVACLIWMCQIMCKWLNMMSFKLSLLLIDFVLSHHGIVFVFVWLFLTGRLTVNLFSYFRGPSFCSMSCTVDTSRPLSVTRISCLAKQIIAQGEKLSA